MPGLKNVSYSLPAELLEAVKDCVQAGRAASANALVRKAIEEYLKKLEMQAYEAAMAEAASDEMFINDINQCMEDYKWVDREDGGSK